MFIRQLLIAAALLAPDDASAQCSQAWDNPSATYPEGVEHHTFRSASMEVDVGFNIDLPPEYAADPSARFPVIYVLHGIGGNEGTMVQTMVPRIRARIAAKLLRPSIIVFANGVVDGFYADAADGSRRIETSIVDELVAHVDATWRTNACASQRAITGFSMGGHGALLYYTKHPERFSSVVVYAGALLDWPTLQQRHPAIASCMFGDDSARFDAFTPWRWASEHAETLRKKAPIRIAVGDLDGLLETDRAMAARLDELGIPNQLEVVPGCAHQHPCLWDTAGDRGVAVHEAAFAACAAGTPDPEEGGEGNDDGEAAAGGCAAGGGGAGPPLTLAVAVAIAALGRRRRRVLVLAVAAVAAAGCASDPDVAPSDGSVDPESEAAIASSVRCSALRLTGTPTAQQGATWVYSSTDADGVYNLSGILLAPSGAGPFPAVVVSHGYGGSAESYSKQIATTMRGWGAVVIATNYTHAAMPSGSPTGDIGASAANLARGWKARQLLSCVSGVDTTRVAAHGHSMGAFVTSGLLAYHPTGFLVASHTAGGVNDAPTTMELPSLGRDEAATIVTPYQQHHGDADVVVVLRMDQLLDEVLTEHGVEHELRVYPGYDHPTMARDATMLVRVRDWYTAHGLF